jgi:pectinesterase
MNLARVAFLGLVALFTTRCALAAPEGLKPDIIVATDDSGDFTTIQAALESVPRDNRERRIILVRNGVYREKVRIDAACVTLRGESRSGTRIEFAQGANDFNAKSDKLGRAVVNIAPAAHDFVLENLTVENTHGVLGTHAFAIYGLADRTVIVDCDVFSQGNDTLSLWRGRAENARDVGGPAAGDPTILPQGGRYYHARLNVRGSVDFICPRGWCYMVDSTITQVNPGATAAIWHDGSGDPAKKFVLRRCRFDGPPDWYLARHHHDAQFFLVDCTFSKAMRDRAPYRVIYPLDGGTASEADVKRNRELNRTNLWGERAYFHNTHREGGDYAWHRDNLAAAPDHPRPEQISAAWTFGGTWDPERVLGPRITKVDFDAAARRLRLVFSERVTVKGRPRVVFASGVGAEYVRGSGSDVLEFAPPADAASVLARLDLRGGAIVATEASATLRFADLTIP